MQTSKLSSKKPKSGIVITEKVMQKYRVLLSYIENGYELVEKDGKVVAIKGDLQPKILLLLEGPEEVTAWRMAKGELTLDDIRRATIRASLKKVKYIRTVEKKEPSLLLLRKRADQLAREALESIGVVIFDVLVDNLTEEGASRDTAEKIAFDVLLRLGMGKEFMIIGDPPRAVAKMDGFWRPWRAGAGPVYVSSYCYNPYYNVNGYKKIPIQYHIIKFRVTGQRYLKGKVVWSEDRALIGKRVYFSRMCPDPESGRTYWTYLYKVGRYGNIVWVYNFSETRKAAQRQREAEIEKQKNAGHFVAPAVYGVDRFFKTYKIVNMRFRRGGLYEIDRPPRARVIRLGEKNGASIKVIDGIEPLLNKFKDVTEEYMEPTLIALGYKAVAANFSYLAGTKLGALLHLHFIHNLITAYGDSPVPPFYFVTILSRNLFAVRRLHNYRKDAVAQLVLAMRDFVETERVAIRFSRQTVYSHARKKTIPLYAVNLVFMVHAEDFGDAVREVNSINKQAISARYEADTVGVEGGG